MGNQAALRIDGVMKEDLPNGKLASCRLKKGDRFIYRAGGGGGFGPPTEREARRVAEDVRQDYVSREAARELYGVALDEAGAVDEAGTRALRGKTAA